MPLYMGLAATPHGLNAIVIEIEGEARRIVFNRTLNFDRDLPEYGTTGGMQRTENGDLPASPVIWADAFDRMMGRLAAAAEVDVDNLRAISGAAYERAGGLHQHLPDLATLNPSAALPAQLKVSSPIAQQFDSLQAYCQSLIVGGDGRLSTYWRRRYALPAAVIVPWTDDQVAGAIGTGIIREGVVAVSFGTDDTITGCAAATAPRTTRISFRNGSLARDLLRIEHRLDWDAIARWLEAAPGNDGCVMLPWAELETTPPIAHAGIRRFGFDRHDTPRNVRGLIEGQLMAMANHASAAFGGTIARVIATGDAAAQRAILQVMANVFDAEVYRLEGEQGAALGAALRAYHADRLSAGEPVSWKTVVGGFTNPKPGHRVSPNPRHAAIYAQLRSDYAMLERLHRDRRPIC